MRIITGIARGTKLRTLEGNETRPTAEAVKEAKIREAEGEAEAILKIQQATADGIKMINEANPGEGVIALKSLEALEKVADGQATKIIIPSEIQNVAGLVASIKGVAEEK